LANKNIWNDWKINFDVVIASVYVIWMLLETKVSKNEISKGDNTSDFGTCEIYALGQAGVIISALWLNPLWKIPTVYHLLGFCTFISGIIFRLWAIKTLGKYYSHIVREVDGHKIIDTGPYSYIRHPAYTGMLVANAGIVLFFFNTITLTIFLFILMPAIVLRILVEEKTLFRIAGYSEFARSRKRLLPVIW
jgi:protein-S-isoprenylcysteine O-methyltransferase Ste14